MGTPNSPLSAGDLAVALAQIGRTKETRDALLALLLRFEASFDQHGGVNVREEITGPIVDALYAPGELLMKELSNGLRFSFRYTSKIARDFLMSGDKPDHVWEPQTTKTIVQLASSAKNVVIGGAYIGDHAILAAKNMALGGACHCFELSHESAELLRTNAKQNGVANVRVNEVGLWSKDDVRLTLEGSDSHATPSETAGSGPSFPTTTIDTYLAKSGVDVLDLLMLDVEGGELEALKGAAKFLAMPADRAPSVIFEIHRAYVDWSAGLEKTELVMFLRSFGYEIFAIRDYQGNVAMGGKPVELVALDGIYVEGPPHGFNMLAVKRPGVIDQPIFEKCTGVSPKLLFHRDPKLHAPLR